MKWKQERLYPTQPYLVLDSSNFRQRIYVRYGISHFYSCSLPAGRLLRIVPDGCVDILLIYKDGQVTGIAAGTFLTYHETKTSLCGEIFGVRFLPGMLPAFLHIRPKDLLEHYIPLEDLLPDGSTLLTDMAAQKTFAGRISTFLSHYLHEEKNRQKPYGKTELVQAVKQLAYESDGKIRIGEMQEKTGYSKRYIHKVFIEDMGYSPKTFCKIIQFQRSLKYLNYGAPEKMTDAAVMLGYYDQSQFIRDFEKFAGTTPGRYLQMIRQEHYQDKIIDTQYMPGTESVRIDDGNVRFLQFK